MGGPTRFNFSSSFKMAMSGIEIDKEACEAPVKAVYTRKLRGVIFGFNEKRTAIVPKAEVERSEDFEADWEKFGSMLPEKQGAYACYDFEYRPTDVYNDGDVGSAATKDKIILIMWAPDNAKPMEKMVIPSSFPSVKMFCEKAQATIEMHDESEKLMEAALKKLNSDAVHQSRECYPLRSTITLH